MQLDEYSINFSKVLYSTFPEFKQYQKIKDYDEYNEAYLLIEIPSPYNNDNILEVTTYGEEITVEFDLYHCHFSYGLNDEEDFRLAVEFIKEIIDEKIAIAVIKKEDEWISSCIIRENKLPKVNEDETIEIKSWNGTYFK